ncbi:MAG: hypothetical protein V4805_07695, partial [Pseudomonadota bacterium]
KVGHCIAHVDLQNGLMLVAGMSATTACKRILCSGERCGFCFYRLGITILAVRDIPYESMTYMIPE